MAKPVTTRPDRSPEKTPTINKTRAPTARMSSGAERCRLRRIVSAVMSNKSRHHFIDSATFCAACTAAV
ncbi:hypothetical protein ACVIKP_002056 [Rhizobium leguminosarum]